ncbi:tetratricopeptide repeat protein [Zooshikella harenae]|uniref:Tetratricopeptide repeat protein n=1 Tax=Zooshikella harenae TaxID=2827238 RepID=A0ABS5ZCU1_9GAMM|nr:hypothetical protein [Zooshikella harenae]MBU2711673.1 hypothetical protein [Zooshikella harenae]
MKFTENLNLDELFHCALSASEQGDHAQSITLLKECIQQEERAIYYYMLAAEHAEIGLYQYAIEEMTLALEKDPSLWIAKFQLSLLYLTIANIEEAVKVWSELKDSNATNYLRMFSEGLLHIQEGNTAIGIKKLKEGIDVNKENNPLNDDIYNIIQSLEENNENEVPEIIHEDNESELEDRSNKDSAINKIFISKYQQNDNEN